MNQLSVLINSINIIWLIPVFFFIHELEEWNILKWYKKYFINMPGSTETSIRIHIFTLSAAAFLLTFAAFVSPVIIRSIIIIFLSGFVLSNTIQHVIWTFQNNAYAPGLSTAILCTIICIFVNILFVKNEILLTPFYVIVLTGIPAIIKTIKLNHQMTPEVRRVHNFFIKVENFFSEKIGEETNEVNK